MKKPVGCALIPSRIPKSSVNGGLLGEIAFEDRPRVGICASLNGPVQ